MNSKYYVVSVNCQSIVIESLKNLLVDELYETCS